MVFFSSDAIEPGGVVILQASLRGADRQISMSGDIIIPPFHNPEGIYPVQANRRAPSN